MQLGSVFRLDDFIFPMLPKESLDFDMSRSIAKLSFPGGPPVYQDMGMDEKTLDLSGSIVGDGAIDISNQIESKWWSGQELQLSCGDLQKRVRIQKYTPKIKRDDRVDYTMHLIVCYPESEIADLANVYGQQPTTNSATSSSAPTYSSPTSIAQTMDKSYTIKQGDTLWGIAAHSDVFNDGTKWELIAKANGITDEYSLQVGQVIKIPSATNAGASISADTTQTATALGTTGLTELQTIAGRAA